MTPDARDTVVVGFDLGHGESAVTIALAETTAQPNVLNLGGEMGGGHQQITAVGQHPSRGVLLGLEAAEDPDVNPFYLAFKSPHLDRDEVHLPVTMFVNGIRHHVTSKAMLPKARHTRWVFGAPSGWSPELREQYRKLLRKSNLTDVEVTPESRAALLYARESEVAVDASRLAGVVLVVDIGSSTTDFTVVNGHENRPIDFGTALGASLIDKEILERTLAAHPDRDLLEETLQDDRRERLRLELTSRRAKEKFFRTPASRFEANPNATVSDWRKVHTRDRVVFFEVELGAADMDAVLDAPQTSLDGRSWRTAFREDLEEVRRRIGKKPGLVLLTGGASRMDFVLAQTRAVFGADHVVMGSEPEVAIARGLALAGRMSVRATGFRGDINKLLKSGSIASLVNDRLPALAAKIGEAATTGITERHVIPAFRRWRSGEIATIDAMVDVIVAGVHAELASPSNPALKQVIAEWHDELLPELEELTRPICLRWHIEPTAMRPPVVSVSGKDLKVQVPTQVATEMMENLGNVASVVVAGVVAMTLFGAGTAIIATTGPIAVIIAFAAAVGVAFVGKDEMMLKARTAIIPVPLRKMRSEDALVRKLRTTAPQTEAQLRAQLAEQFVTDGGPALTRDLTTLIETELNAQAETAELLIS